jgi:hypothetical protein
MHQHEDPAPEEVPADAISWLLLACMAAAVLVGLFLMVRTP